MLVTIALWIYLTLLCLLYGFGAIAGLRRLFSAQAVLLPGSIVVLLGLIVLAWLSSLLSLVMKLGLAAHLLVLAGALLIACFERTDIKPWLSWDLMHRHWVVWGLAVLVSLVTLLYAVKIPYNPDTSLYHAQAIHWIEDYRVVPGLGNLDPRLGTNSNWFTLHALLSFSFLGGRSFHVIPSFLFLAALFYFLTGIQSLLGDDIRLSHIVKVSCIPLAFYVLIDEVSSPGTDLPVILFYWVILCLWLDVLERPAPFVQVVVFVFAVFVITLKMSGIPILLVALVLIYPLIKERDIRRLRGYAGVAAVAVLPWMIRTFILTGYWLYPEPLMQFFSLPVDWRVPVDRVLSFKQGVQAWALAPRTVWDDVAAFSKMQQFKFWLVHLTRVQQGMFVAALLSPLLFLALPKRKRKEHSYIPVAVVAYLSFLFWLLTAPNFRFGYGFVLALPVLGLAPLALRLCKRSPPYRTALFLVVILMLTGQQLSLLVGARRDGTQYANYMLLPADYVHVPTDPCDLDGVTIFCARRLRQCSYDAFPCVPKLPNNVRMRGDTFLNGWRKVSDP